MQQAIAATNGVVRVPTMPPAATRANVGRVARLLGPTLKIQAQLMRSAVRGP